MKKLLAILLALVTAFSLFACGGGAVKEEKAKETTVAEVKTGGTLKIVATSESYKDLFAKFETMMGEKAEK